MIENSSGTWMRRQHRPSLHHATYLGKVKRVVGFFTVVFLLSILRSFGLSYFWFSL